MIWSHHFYPWSLFSLLFLCSPKCPVNSTFKIHLESNHFSPPPEHSLPFLFQLLPCLDYCSTFLLSPGLHSCLLRANFPHIKQGKPFKISLSFPSQWLSITPRIKSNDLQGPRWPVPDHPSDCTAYYYPLCAVLSHTGLAVPWTQVSL